MDTLGSMRRTHGCNELGLEHVGEEVVLMGWVQRRRDHGGVIFVDLRDRDGLTQVVFNPEENADVHERAHAIRPEYVLLADDGVDAIVESPADQAIGQDVGATGQIEGVVVLVEKGAVGRGEFD